MKMINDNILPGFICLNAYFLLCHFPTYTSASPPDPIKSFFFFRLIRPLYDVQAFKSWSQPSLHL